MELIKIIIISLLLMALMISFIGLQLSTAANLTFMQIDSYDKILMNNEFYGHLRQLIFSTVRNTFPHGQDSIPYLDKALTEEWLREEILEQGDSLFLFFRGKADSIPIIPLYRLKERLKAVIEQEEVSTRRHLENELQIRFWFPGLPDRVRMHDIVPLGYLWMIRRYFQFIRIVPFLLAAAVILLMTTMFGVTTSIRDVILWVGTGMAAAGIITIGLCLSAGWMVTNSSVSWEIVTAMTMHGFPKQFAERLLWSFINAFTLRLNVSAVIFILAGAAAVFYVPLKQTT
jgi:hypothetical protein